LRAWSGRPKRVSAKAQLFQLGSSDRDSSQLNVVLLAVQRSLGLGLHGDDAGRPRYLVLEVGIAGNGHELDVTRPPHDDVVWSGEVDHSKMSISVR
jgi:hypothetical protein